MSIFAEMPRELVPVTPIATGTLRPSGVWKEVVVVVVADGAERAAAVGCCARGVWRCGRWCGVCGVR